MRKKFSFLLTAILGSLVAGFCACEILESPSKPNSANIGISGSLKNSSSQSSTTHKHIFDTLSYDANGHWYECNCGKKDDEIMHSYNNYTCSVCRYTASPTQGVEYDLSIDGTYAEVIGYTGNTKGVVIADTYQGVAVTSIYDKAFYEKAITSVLIPNSVTSIGDAAFSGCDSLTSVTIGSSITSMGWEAFSCCNKLTSATINSKLIGRLMFAGCSSLTSVTIGDDVTSIGEYAFSDCYNLRYTQYGNAKYLGNEENSYIALIATINDNYTSYDIHPRTKFIAPRAFASCNRLTKMVIPDGITVIGESAFRGCDNLKNVTIGNGVTSIEKRAFSYCYSLTSITISSSVTLIGSEAFYGCSDLTQIIYKGSVSTWKKIKKDGNRVYDDPVRHVVCLDGTVTF